MVAEAPPAEAGRIRLNTRTIENRASECISLFFIVTPPLFTLLYSPPPSIDPKQALIPPYVLN
jgi:hypothetical protein